jgi:hypothetical protein
MAIVVLAHNALNFTQRAVRSILEHTVTPFQLIVIDHASTDGTAGWFSELDDPRVRYVQSSKNLGVSGGRNAGIARVPASARYVTFLDNDVEVLAGWDLPFVAALELDENAAIAGELGVNLEWTADGRREHPLKGCTGPLPTDMAVGFCMVMRADALELIGRFDEGLGLFWHDDDDYAIRAKRLGYGVLHIGSELVLHFEHRSSELVDGLWAGPETPSELSQTNQQFLAAKWERQLGTGLEGARPFTVLAFADELTAHPGLLHAYCDAFSDADAATLVVYAPGMSDFSNLEALFDGADVDVLVLAPAEVTDDDEAALSQQVEAVLSERAPDMRFGAPPRAGSANVSLLRNVAARVWTARSVLAATCR